MEIEHRRYLLSYHKQSFYGFWKSIMDNPPCKPPGSPRNKEFSYELEQVFGEKHELYLHLIGESSDLNTVEKQLSKFKIARLEPLNRLVFISNEEVHPSALYMFLEFCRDKDFMFLGKEIHRENRMVKIYR
jgi:hypothetical protein